MANLHEVRLEAERRMKQWGLLPTWSFAFDRSLSRFGCCRYSRRLITLSRHLCSLNTMADIIDTILHEIAHALADKKAGHGPRWKMMALKVGCRPIRCYHDGVVTPTGKYVAECPNCHHKIFAHRRRRRNYACHLCCKKYSGGRYDERFRLTFRQTNIFQDIGREKIEILKTTPTPQDYYTIWGGKGFSKPVLDTQTQEPKRFKTLEEAEEALQALQQDDRIKAKGIQLQIQRGMGDKIWHKKATK